MEKIEDKIILVLKKHNKSINSDELKEEKFQLIWREAQKEFIKELKSLDFDIDSKGLKSWIKEKEETN